MVFVGTYFPDGRTGTYPAMDHYHGRSGSRLHQQSIVALGDLNCRARTLGHSRLNDSGPILDTWIQVSDNLDVHFFTEPTRPASQGFLDVIIYKDLDAPPEISFEDRIPYDHRGILTRIDLKDGHNLSRESPLVRLKMRPNNKALTELVRQKIGFTLQEFAHIVRTEVQRRQKHRRPSSKNHQYRCRWYWFKPSKSLERIKESMFQAQKAGQQDRFQDLRNQYQKMLKMKGDKASTLTWKRHPSPKTRKNSTT